MAKKKTEEPTYEELMAETEAMVEALESGELPLEEALARYEKGVGNLKKCAGLIKQAQEKVQALIADQEGEEKLVDFDEDEED